MEFLKNFAIFLFSTTLILVNSYSWDAVVTFKNITDKMFTVVQNNEGGTNCNNITENGPYDLIPNGGNRTIGIDYRWDGSCCCLQDTLQWWKLTRYARPEDKSNTTGIGYAYFKYNYLDGARMGVSDTEGRKTGVNTIKNPDNSICTKMDVKGITVELIDCPKTGR